MKPLLVREIALAVGAVADPALDRDVLVVGVGTDSRSIGGGECFFAIRGPSFDGHDYVTEAFDRGAVCAVVSKPVQSCHGRTLLFVPDTIVALGILARHCRLGAGFAVVGVTGSVGKTTTRRIISQILGRYVGLFESPGNYNNGIGLPLTLLSAGPRHRVVVVEMGTSSPGEIEYLSRIAQPDIAVVTNACEAHMEFFPDLRAVAVEKLAIASGLRAGGKLFINGDCEILVEEARSKGLSCIGFGRSTGCDIRFGDVRLCPDESEFTVNGVPVHLPLPGMGNVYNAAAAWSVCAEFNLSIGQFAAATLSVEPVRMRSQVIRMGTLTVVSDCYNANPASMENALQVLRLLAGERGGRAVFVCGDMAELGSGAERHHRRIGAMAAESVKLLVAVGPLSKKAAAQAASGGIATRCFDSAEAACLALDEFIRHDDVILVKGSRSTGLEKIVEGLGRFHAAKL